MAEGRRAVDDVRAYLRPFNIKVLELPGDTSTAVLAAQALGTSVETIVKSLLFHAGDEPILALVAGDRKIDRVRLAKELGVSKVRLATPEDVIRATGYAVGGVPPVAHRQELRIVFDRNLLAHSTVYAAAGASNAVFPISPDRLLKLTGGEITNATL